MLVSREQKLIPYERVASDLAFLWNSIAEDVQMLVKGVNCFQSSSPCIVVVIREDAADNALHLKDK